MSTNEGRSRPTQRRRLLVSAAVLALLLAAVPSAALAQSSTQTSCQNELYSRDYSKDIDFGPDVEWPRGAWGDGDTLWVVDPLEDKIFAYDITAGDTFGDRLTGKDIDISADSHSARGIWSDGFWMYVSNEFNTDWDHNTANVKAYLLSDGSRSAGRDFDLYEYNNDPRGLWSDGDTFWVLQPDTTVRNDDQEIIFQAKSKIYAYSAGNQNQLGSVPGARQSSKDINNLFSDGTIAGGLWSDGTTIWTTSTNVSTDANDNGIGRVYAFTLSSGARDSSNEFYLQSSHSAPQGLWSDGETVWIADTWDDKFYAYHMCGWRAGGV
ncbi:MAG: hypothetical protein OXH42_04550 [Acidimicrobiaceae bacterium]|nr:hypothetical protein [Acidimicrobiaceae bacterium]